MREASGSQGDTIAALASAAGPAGVAVIRVSGPQVPMMAQALLGGLPRPRQARVCRFKDRDGSVIDHGVALYFAAPASFTGEPVLELQGHGSPLLVDNLLERLVGLGARLAGPGEFSQRAFLNGKLSLDQAEAIADLIAAGSKVSARAAMRSLEGAFAREVEALVEGLTQLRMYTEAAIDFPDEEDVDFLQDGAVEDRLSALKARLLSLRARAGQGAAFREGLRLIILGRPNVGKSSLLNRLAQRETAIVTRVAGTTRDVLRERLSVDGLPLTLVDTAGLRETDDPVEAEGVRRARAELACADGALFVYDHASGLTARDRQLMAEIGEKTRTLLVANKIDLSGAEPGRTKIGEDGVVRVSAISGEGFDVLKSCLKSLVGADETAESEPEFIARRRHLSALDLALQALNAGQKRLVEDVAGDLLAEELRQAQDALGEITGAVTSEDLLGRIFSSFCIGK